VGFFLPILPLFVRGRGGLPVLVGLVFGFGVAGRLLAQYPAGWLADHVGRRPMIIGSLLVYALIFPVYLLPMPPAALIAVRFFHSMAAGTYLPAALALVADLTPPASRGRVFGQLRASDMLGLLVGPALGGLVAGFRLEYVFLAGAVICLAAVALLLGLPAAPARAGPRDDARPEPVVRPLSLLWGLLPVIALGAPIYWTAGMYDTVWSLYLTSRGASTVVVGLSYATYALPGVLLSGLAGGLADRLGHLRAGTLALLTFGLMASTYPFISSVPLLIGVGLLEGTLTAAGTPALNAEVSRRAPGGAQGRIQGLYQTALGLAQIAGAAASGLLYGIRPAFAFFGTTAACLVGVGASLLLRRAAQWDASSPSRTPSQR
jgi:MFS transporter, DHA1 family, multidrug resistance protein